MDENANAVGRMHKAANVVGRNFIFGSTFRILLLCVVVSCFVFVLMQWQWWPDKVMILKLCENGWLSCCHCRNLTQLTSSPSVMVRFHFFHFSLSKCEGCTINL